MGLGQMVEDQGEFVVRQNLHMVLGSRSVFRQDLRNGFGGQTEVLCHFMHSVFFHT